MVCNPEEHARRRTLNAVKVWLAVSTLLASSVIGCAKPQPVQPAAVRSIRHYRLVDRAVNPIPGEPEFLEVSIPTEYLDTRILPPPAEGETRALFISVPSSLEPTARYFCRMTYSSPNPTGTVGDGFSVDLALAPHFGVPEGFDCRKGTDQVDGRPMPPDYVQYYCEDPRVRESGGQLETFCRFENTRPTATCALATRIPSRAYLDCEYSPRDVSHIRTIAEDVAAIVEPLVRRPSASEPSGRMPQ